MFLPRPIITILAHFEPLFTTPTWKKVVILLYRVFVLLGNALHPDGHIPVQHTAWYPKTQATFSDVLATVRLHLWGGLTFQTSASPPDLCLVPRTDLIRLLQAACS